MVKAKDLGIGFHYIGDEIIINLNKIFFKDLYERSDAEVAVDGYIILEDNIKESLREETLERIYRMYKKHGIKFIEKVKSGKFNILIYDKKVRKIFVANDYLGCLPFYYTLGKPVRFSSNILNLENENNLYENIDWYGISQYIKYAFMIGDKTQYSNIKFLPPHSIFELDLTNQKVKIHSYTPKNVIISSNLEKLFKKACQRLYTDELEYSLGLSGGIDSRFVLYNWPNKNDLSVHTSIPEEADSAAREDLEIAIELTSVLDIPNHRVIKYKIMSVNDLNKQLKEIDPFEIRKLYTSTEKLPKVSISGDFAPIISGEWLVLRHKKFLKSILLGKIVPEVSRFVLDEAITRIPTNAIEKYISPVYQKHIINIPLEKEKYHVENYNTFERWRRWVGFDRRCCRDREIILPFMDYDFMFSCLTRRDRLNNKLYYAMCKKMPYPYNIRVTRYALPLTYPYPIQYLSMLIKDTMRRFRPGSSHTEEIGGIIAKRENIKKYMINHIEKAEFIQNIDELATDIYGGRKGHFFFLSFIVSYWLNEKMIGWC